MDDLFNKVRLFVDTTYRKAGKKKTIPHLERTVYWVRQLRPAADEALLIAAMSHDIERAVYGDWVKGSTKKEILKKHGALSADIIAGYLSTLNADKALIDEVKGLVAMHELGGDPDQNILRDADSISYLETRAPIHATEWLDQGVNKERIRKKFKFMYARLQSEKARIIATPFFEKALESVED